MEAAGHVRARHHSEQTLVVREAFSDVGVQVDHESSAGSQFSGVRSAASFAFSSAGIGSVTATRT